jgi:hypothetical protein
MMKWTICFFILISTKLYCDEVKEVFHDDYALYLEASTKNISIHCTHPKDRDDEWQLASLYVQSKTTIYDFIFRRPYTGKICQQVRKKIMKILKENKTVKVLMITPFVNDLPDSMQIDDRGILYPKKNGRKGFYGYFDCIDNEKGQHFGFFDTSCTLDIKNGFQPKVDPALILKIRKEYKFI